ncbi:MAG: thioredoxin domain-containing protein [Candidatus Peribacteraceae bacterium]|nr:thioredoxin domain-containing protein [Candidatus Peribacteraceae bacterium]MDD5074517.1 thioredoxin domain-containing protein [Candidatus Peribacteraceae bacterium]
MKRLLLPFFALILASCTLPVRTPPAEQAESSSSSLSVSSVSSARIEEVEGTGERAPTTEELTETGSLAERLLPSGVLEVGEAAAPVTLLIFTEHNCSYCRQFLTELFPRLRSEYVDKGILKIQIAMLTLKKYAASSDAAHGLICASAQGKGFQMHRILFQNPNKSPDAIRSYAQEMALDQKTFDACLKSGATAELVSGQEGWAGSLNVSVVPAFFLNGEKFIGLPYYPDLRGRIEEAIKKAKEQ